VTVAIVVLAWELRNLPERWCPFREIRACRARQVNAPAIPTASTTNCTVTTQFRPLGGDGGAHTRARPSGCFHLHR